MKLVIVESPAKAKTISKILGKEYTVESSIGHIRDLPKKAADIPAKLKSEKWTRLGVNVDKNFEALYVVSPDKKKQVKKLQDLLKKADELYLATDEDREGEAISWHLLEVLKPKVPVKRLAFHEITKEAIEASLKNPREVDMQLVSAQETRRILDRLYGYEVSPILWRKIAPKLSAGRVQSVALRVIVERERARTRFKTAYYCSLIATFETEKGEKFEAVLKTYKDQKLAIGKDFDPDTGKLINEKLLLLAESDAKELVEEFKNGNFVVDAVDEKPTKSSPYAPFITSTLQQEGNRKLGFGSKQTMMVAQKLYENGYITYMRTDSISLSAEAITAARDLIKAEYGEKYLPVSPRVFKSKVKNAQEAHEAIRPAGNHFRTPKEIRNLVNEDEFRLYELIYKRTLASQMKDAEILQTAVKITSQNCMFQANGRVIKFDGYLKLYSESYDDSEAEDNERNILLPALKVGQKVKMHNQEIKLHETKPPARYTEATLVKELEAKGIGRPSTYASIIDTILKRNYVFRAGKALVPTFMAFAVVRLLELNFEQLVDMQFTAGMEEDLDAISRGEEKSVKYLKNFYFGSAQHTGLKSLIDVEIDAREACTIPIEGVDDVAVRIGPYGPYLEKGELKVSLPVDVEPDKLNLDLANQIIENGKSFEDNVSLGVDPVTDLPVYAKVGRYGPYIQLGDGDKEKKIKPKMKSIPKGVEIEDVDLDLALKIVSMPRKLGVFEDNGAEIVADIGRFGPYLKAGVETRSVNAETILNIDLAKATEILRTEKPTRGRRGATKPPIKEFEGSKIKILDGRYGPYVTDGKSNVSVPKGSDPAAIELKEAEKMLKNKGKN